MLITLESDAFADCQIASKIWLCSELEKLWRGERPPVVWLLAGWYAMTGFLLFSRGIIEPAAVVSFDCDPGCAPLARRLNNRWEIEGRFITQTADINAPGFAFDIWGPPPDIVVNTSCEHLESDWYAGVPAGTLVALQGCDMPHEQHANPIASEDDLLALYPMTHTLYRGSLPFQYPDKAFRRSMVIGRR